MSQNEIIKYRRLLCGVRWLAFWDQNQAEKMFSKVLRARIGKHMNRLAMAVMTEEDFIAIRYLDYFIIVPMCPLDWKILDPTEDGYFNLGKVFLNQDHPDLAYYIVHPSEFYPGAAKHEWTQHQHQIT